MVSGVPGGIIFGGIFAKCAFLWEPVVPSILNDSTTFWLDFERSNLPETSKIDKTLSVEMPFFLNHEKKRPGPVFLDFGGHFGLCFGDPAC